VTLNLSPSALFERYTLSRLASLGAQGRVVHPLGVPMHLIELPRDRVGAGEAPPLILVHGLGSSAASYGALIKLAHPHFEALYAPSAPAHGLSPYHERVHDPEALFELWRAALDELTKERPALLLGTSLGGAISLRYALERPERTLGLLLCSPAGAQMSAEEIEQLRATFHMSRYSDARRFLRQLFYRPPPLSPLIALGVRAALNAPYIQGFLRDLTPSTGLSSEELSQLKRPTLLMWGAQERILPRGVLERYQASIPSALLTLIEPPGFSHSPQLESPRELLDLILAWLEQRRVDSSDERPKNALKESPSA
jgi:pimeloyl-ACP methyl ester carboxylesterase